VLGRRPLGDQARWRAGRKDCRSPCSSRLRWGPGARPPFLRLAPHVPSLACPMGGRLLLRGHRVPTAYGTGSVSRPRRTFPGMIGYDQQAFVSQKLWEWHAEQDAWRRQVQARLSRLEGVRGCVTVESTGWHDPGLCARFVVRCQLISKMRTAGAHEATC